MPEVQHSVTGQQLVKGAQELQLWEATKENTHDTRSTRQEPGPRKEPLGERGWPANAEEGEALMMLMFEAD